VYAFRVPDPCRSNAEDKLVSEVGSGKGGEEEDLSTIEVPIALVSDVFAVVKDETPVTPALAPAPPAVAVAVALVVAVVVAVVAMGLGIL
jgi:hypothetical protein